MKKFLKLSILSSVLFSSSLMANNCEYFLGISNDIEGQLFKYGKEVGLFNLVEKKFDCKLKISENKNHKQTIYSLIANKQEVDGAILKNIDIHYNIGAVKQLNNILLSKSNNLEVVSKNSKNLNSLNGQTIYLTKKTYMEYALLDNLKDVGLNKDNVNLVNVESEEKLIDGYSKGLYDNILLESSMSNNLSGNKIKFKEAKYFSLVSTLERTENYNKKKEFIENITLELLKNIERDAGTEYNNIVNKIKETNNFKSTNEVKSMIKSMNFFNNKSNLDDLYEIEEKGYNYIISNKLNKYNLPYSIFINNKVIGNKNNTYKMFYTNINVDNL